jgi:16S rRNA G966 N2-methylase RsmD
MLPSLQLEPITRRIPAERQGAKRHYGVHPYFTRRAANVVRDYIMHFTEAGDTVLDPFGGSGVTAIEAMLANRRGIHNDINPLANFIASQIADTTYEDTTYIKRAFLEVQTQCKARVERVPSMSESEVGKVLADADLPENIRLPRSSDAERYFDLFSPKQLLALAWLKAAIDRIPDPPAREALLIAWSATLGKLNRTFLSARGRLESRGGSSIFSIYRYKLAGAAVDLPPWEVFHERVMNVIEGKREVLRQKRIWAATNGWQGSFEAHCLDVADLPAAIGRKVDYIFTDPPYGGHIAYLDLSVLWNHWLGFPVPMVAREREIIVGGELRLTEEHYTKRLRESVRICLSMLKRNRWLSIVFQHWNVRYFAAILEEATEAGAELRAAVTQIGDTIWSMHKKKNKERVLAGEMILSFCNNQSASMPHYSRSPAPTLDALLAETLAEVSPDGRPFAGEILFNRMILKAWNSGALTSLDVTREEFTEALTNKGWRYNSIRHQWFHALEPAPAGLQFTF